MKVQYSTNNSGGDWWLSDEQWQALEDGGWDVAWKRDETDWNGKPYPDGRWLGALATEASREALSIDVAIAEFEAITGERASDEGCSCCGSPHGFYAIDENGRYIW